MPHGFYFFYECEELPVCTETFFSYYSSGMKLYDTILVISLKILIHDVYRLKRVTPSLLSSIEQICDKIRKGKQTASNLRFTRVIRL